MKNHPIPLFISPSSKGFAKSIGSSAAGAQLINAVLEVSINRQLNSKTVYSTKRAGSAANASTPTATGLLVVKHNSSRFSNIYTGGAGFALYSDATNIGTLTGHLSTASNYQACDAISSNVGILGFVTSDGAGWILYEDAISTNFPTFTGNRTSGSAIISGIASTTGIYKGQAISGTGIPASTRVLSVDSGTQITMSANATSGAATATTITKEAVSKITTTDFPSGATNMEQIDGYFAVGTTAGALRHSGLNDPFTWTTTFSISADLTSDNLVCIFRHGEFICAAGSVGTIQYFYNAGNPAGSVFSAANQLDIIGISCKHRPALHGTGLYFIGSEKNETGQVSSLYRLNGTNSIEQVSPDLWSSIITDTSLSFVSPITNGDKSLLALHSSSAATFPVYDPSLNEFTSFELGAALTSASRRTFTVSGTSTAIDWAVGDTWTDSSAAYTYTAITEPQGPFGELGSTDIYIDLIADIEASGTASLSVSDDFYTSWVSRGSFDMTSNIKRIWRCGFHKGQRAYKLQHSANTGFRAQLLTVNMA